MDEPVLSVTLLCLLLFIVGLCNYPPYLNHYFHWTDPGFAVDLAKKLAEYVGFNFEFRVVADGNYGTRDEENGTWNGMMGELIDGVRTSRLPYYRITIHILFNHN